MVSGGFVRWRRGFVVLEARLGLHPGPGKTSVASTQSVRVTSGPFLRSGALESGRWTDEWSGGHGTSALTFSTGRR